jgi:hypothetical protein
MKKINQRIIYWLPRALSILFILFISLFSFDVFSEGYNIWKTILAFLIHNIPTLILVVLLIISWRWEWIGTIVFNALAVFYVIWAWGNFPGSTYLIIAGPLVLIGFLFMLSWVFKVKDSVDQIQIGKNRRKTLLYVTAFATILLFAAGVFAWKANTGKNLIPGHTSILQPQEGALVKHQIHTMGGFTQSDSEKDLWMVVRSVDSLQFHPQPGPLMKPPGRMRWYSTAYFGKPDDEPGKQYHVYLFSATEEASNEFKAYLKIGNETGQWPGMKALPVGLTPLDTVTVMRE